MPFVRGATILDLIAEVPPGAQGFIPAEISRFIDLLNIAEIRTRTSGAFFVHEGRVQSAEDVGLGLGPDFPVEIPGLNVGVPFQLGWVRPPTGTDASDLEAEPSAWVLDLVLDRVAVVIPFGRPGHVVATSAVAPAYMERGEGERVRLYARGVLRIEGGAAGTSVRLIADPDPIVPTAASGAVIETGFSPPHLLLHDSGFGLSVDRVILDLTDAFTPAEIVARGHDATFEGLTIDEATLYLPRNIPFVGDVNLGVRDLLVGWAPRQAFQGKARVELGVPLGSATGLAFFQEIDGRVETLGGATGAGRELTVTVHPATGPVARITARLQTPDVTADFRLPGGGSVVGGESGWFDVSMAPGAPSLRVVEQRTEPDGGVIDAQERTIAFVRSTAGTGHAPHIRVRYANTGFLHDFDEVVSLRGPGIAMDFVQFSIIEPVGYTDEDRAGLRWQWSSDGSTREGEGVTFDLDTGWAQGTHLVTVTDRHQQVRRCRIEVVGEGPLFVGHRTGGVRQVVTTSNQPATIRAVENSWDLGAFHRRDALVPAGAPATLSGTTLTVPQGTLAEVTVGTGDDPTDPAPPAPPTAPPGRHVRIRMDYNDDTVREWRQIRPTSGSPYGPPSPYPRFPSGGPQLAAAEDALDRSYTRSELEAWIASLPPTTNFVVVGRCCDLGQVTRNRELAMLRANRGRTLLMEAGVDPSRIQQIGEQGVSPDEPEAGYDAMLSFAAGDADLLARVGEGWRIKADYDAATRAAWGDAQARPEREEARGVEIFAVVDPAAPITEAPDTSERATTGPSLLRMLVPGLDADATVPFEARGVQLPYRVEVLATWDSPSIINDIDWVPTLAQVTVEWASSAVSVPGLSSGESIAPTQPNPATGPDLWRIIGRFTTDQRSGATTYLLSIDSLGDADGLFAIVDGGAGRADETVAVGLALAPALLGGITTDDPGGAAVRIAALIAASAAAAALEIDGQHVINEGKVVVEKVEGEVRVRAIDATEGMKVRLSVDYTASFGVQANLGGAVGVSTTQPIKVKYRNVGVEYDHDSTKPIMERLRFVFEDAAFEVADPGRWSITGALGDLLGITAIRVGAGSVWVEVDLEFAIDLGVVKISRTTIRLEIDTSGPSPSISVQLRGITASIDVPGTIKGAGALQVLSDGFAASLELDIIPAKLKAWGAFAYRDPSMVHIEGGVRFATGIPLGSTGLGLFGFAGRFVANGRRNLTGLDPTDIFAREIGWHERAVINKYEPAGGQFAVGFGAYVGTLPDAGFTFNALGMLTIGFPDISVVFAIDAVLLSAETKSATEEKPAPPSNALTLIGIVAIDPTAIGIAIQANYSIEKVLTLQVPIGAYFPLQGGPQGGYVRVGSDGGDGRPDRPVTVQILPDVLDLRATAFFMVEERHLRKLGKRDSLNFEGFSIGFGAGLSVKWGGGPIYLKVSLSILVGIGTRPFMLAGGIYVQGELRLIIVSLSVSGELEAFITEAGSQLRGEFCGKVDFFFFSIKGCVSFTVGSTPALDAPPADPLITGLVLSDKFSRVVGEGREQLADLGDANTAWPDTVPVLRFAHRVRSSIPGSTTGFRPSPEQGWGSVDWSGTNRVRFLYELQSVDLLRYDAGGTPTAVDTSGWPAAWWLPAFRNGVPSPGDTSASTHEGWDLALLQWHPSPWARVHTEGGEGLEADPARSIENVCTPAPRPTRYCVHGGEGQRLTLGRVRFAGEPSGQSPYAPDFMVDAREGIPPTLGVESLAALAPAFGFGFAPGERGALPAPFTPPGESAPLTDAWRLPRFTRAAITTMSLGLKGTFVPEVSQPELLLAVCISLPDTGARERVCLDMQALRRVQITEEQVQLGAVLLRDRGRMLRLANNFPVSAPDGMVELSFSSKGLEVTLPADTEHVWVEVGTLKSDRVRLIGIDESGAPVALAESSGGTGFVHAVELRGARIRTVVVIVPNGTGHLLRLCYEVETVRTEGEIVKQMLSMLVAPTDQSVPAMRLAAAARRPRVPLPMVIGLRGDKTEPWKGEVVGVAIEDRHGCAYVRYTPPHAGPWSAFQIMPYPYFEIGLVRVCAIRNEALVAADQDDQARGELQDSWNDAATGPAIERYALLDPDTSYGVRVTYRAAVWVAPNGTASPPAASSMDFGAPPDDVTVTSPAPQLLHFRTARRGVLPDVQVPEHDKQSRFDPRALTRYVRGFDPVAEVPSHLRDDPMLVWFDVEWIEDLLDRYDYDLTVIVRRTDPPPTPPSGVPPVILPTLTMSWSGLPFELRNLADRRMITAAVPAPCIEDAPIDGATMQVTADLEPRARYDLVVQARSRPSGDVTDIALAHFRASRYRDVPELIEATGFSFDVPNPFYPVDLLVAAAPPGDVRLGDDALLDASLAALGLDPLAPAVGPRSLALWQEIGGAWRLVGLLLDSDEALDRQPRLIDPVANPARLRIASARISGVALPATSELIPVRSNASATRILLAAPSGIAVPPEAFVELTIVEPSGTNVARRSINALPLVVTQERI